MNAVTVFNAIHVVSVAVLCFLLLYTFLQKPSKMQPHIVMLSISCILMIVGYMIETSSESLDVAIMGASVSYLGKPFIMLSSMMLMCSFYNIKVSKALYALCCIYCAMFPLVVFTNPLHHLYYATVDFNPDALFTPLVLTRGYLYYSYIATCIIYFVLCIVINIIGIGATKNKLKNRLAVYSILMCLSGIIGYVIYLSNITKGYDSTILGVSVGVVFLSILFFRCKIFDIIDKAKDNALDISNDGLIVFDDSMAIVYKNKSADFFLDCIPNKYLYSLNDGESLYRAVDKTYSVTVTTMKYGETVVGKSCEIQDVTALYNYQQSLEAAIKATTEHLSNIQRTIFGSFASIVEARSLETGDHIARVSEYASMISHKLLENRIYKDILNEDYVKILVLSAPLHDIGKVSVPDTILNKPGRLTDEEYEIMKSHAKDGAEIIRRTLRGLESDQYINMAADIAMYHHERFNGTGYPMGLSGHNIPLCARIVALADCYDAMTSKRCYKDAIPKKEALQVIRNESGTHFDPFVVTALLEALNEL